MKVDVITIFPRMVEAGLAEGGIPIGSVLVHGGEIIGRGHNRRVQDDDPSMHAETAAFRAAGRQRDYRTTVMVTTLSPCWYCSGLVRASSFCSNSFFGNRARCSSVKLNPRGILIFLKSTVISQ